MRNLLYCLFVTILVASCQKPGGDQAEVGDAQETATASENAKVYIVDLDNSLVTWIGSKPAGKHNGTINLSSGTISVDDLMVTAGDFVLDMSTVTARDDAMDAEKNEQLTGHLLSEDFFHAEKYPTGKFEIVSVEDIADHASGEALKLEGATHFITGNLTMKDSTKAVKFPAIIKMSDDFLEARARFHINRTDWGMHYKSDKSFGDQIIHPRVEVGFDITAAAAE